MTQPPSQPPPPGQQPGQQPGYGYPQGPPQGEPGYGYPQQTPPVPGQPPGQPGQPGPYNQPGPYGQQPGQPGPYAQPGPYNQPGQPGPYGSQPNPYGGGGGGYPPQQFPGAPTPPPGGGSGGGNFFQRKPGIVIAAAVAGLLVIGGGTWFAVSGDDGGGGKKKNVSKDRDAKPTGESVPDDGDGTGGGREAQDDLNAGRKDGESKVLWLQKNDVDLPKNGAEVYGPWFAGDVVAKAMYKKIVGYGAADGKQKWSLTLPAEACAAPSLPTDDGKIVIAIKDGVSEKADCTVLQQVDLKTGKGGWKQEVKQAGNWDFLSDITLAINGGTVTAARTGHVNAYRMSDGKELFDEVPGDCQPNAISSGPRMIAAETCPGDADNQQNQVQELDPTTGKARWTYKLKTKWELDKVYSSNPIVLSLTEPDKKSWAIVALNDNGTVRSQIDGGKDKFQPNCGGSFIVFGANLDGCSGIAADANTFYMSTQPSETGSTGTNEVVAFNLATGKAKWRAKAPSQRVMTPLRMEGANVVLYFEPSYDKGGAVATLAPTGGSPKVLLQNPESTSEIESSFYSSELDYVDGRFYVTSSRVSATDDKAEMETKTMMAFGK